MSINLSKVNCNKLKDDLYKCLENSNLNFKPELLKFDTLSHIKDINKVHISSKKLKLCNSDEFAKCLNEKYKMKNYDENKMISYFSKQYDDMLKEQTEQNILKNKKNINNSSTNNNNKK